MVYEYFTVGGGELMADILNGNAMLLKGGANSWVVHIGSLLGFFGTCFYAAIKNSGKIMLQYAAYYSVIVGFLLVPTATLVVTDSITGKHFPVKNLPWSLCFVAGNFSAFGHAMTKQFETVFTIPGDLNYRKSGMVFGSKIIRDLQNIKVDDVGFQTNVNNFVNQCMVAQLRLGFYSVDELANSSNIWELLRERSNDGVFYQHTNPSNGKRELVSCKDAIDNLEGHWDKILDKTATGLGAKYYGRQLSKEQAKKRFLSDLDLANRVLLRGSGDQSDLLKQKVMISALKNGWGNTYAKRGDVAGMNLYAAALGKEHQSKTMKTQQMLSEDNIVITKIIFEGLLLMLYPIMILLSTMSLNGYKAYFKYLETLFWLMTWPVVFTALNYIMTYYAVDGSTSLALRFDDLTVWNGSNELAGLHEGITEYAGALMLMTAGLSHTLIRGGAGSFVHMAGQFGSAVSGGAQVGASQAASGGWSHGGASLDSRQANNLNANKLDDSWGLGTTNMTKGNAMGSTTTYTPAGQRIIHDSSLGGSAIDNINVSSDISRGWSEASREAKEISDGKTTALAENTQHGVDQMQQLSSSIEKMKSNNKNWNENFAEDERKALNEVVKINKALVNSTEESIGDNVANEKHGTLGFGAMGSSIGATVKSGHQATKNEAFKKMEELSKSKDLQSALSTVASSGKSKNLTIGNQSSDRFVEDFRETFNKSSSLRTEQQSSLRDSKAFSQEASNTKRDAVSINQNASGAWQNFLENKLRNKAITPKQYENLRSNSANPHVRATLFKEFSKDYADKHIKSRVHDVRNSLDEKYKNNSAQLKNDFGHKGLSGGVKEKAANKGVTKPVSTDLQRTVDTKQLKNKTAIDVKAQKIFKGGSAISSKNAAGKAEVANEIDAGVWGQIKTVGNETIEGLSKKLGGEYMVDEDSPLSQELARRTLAEKKLKGGGNGGENA